MSSLTIVDLLKNLVENDEESWVLELLSQGVTDEELIERFLKERTGCESY